MDHPRTIIGLGELLWDLLPTGPQLGGAPANFAYCSHLLGSRAEVASRVGSDALGREARHLLRHSGLADQFLQTDLVHPTGTVKVQLDSSGQPHYEIAEPVAWDFLNFSDLWRSLAQSADAVCFGTLAQRSPQSRQTILDFLAATRQQSLRVFDVNLRQSFYSAEIIRESLHLANVVKMNHEEVPRVAELLAVASSDARAFSRDLLDKFDLKLVCITRGANGSLLCDRNHADEHPGFRVQIKDTVGAGDAFTAALIHQFLHGSQLPEMNDVTNRMGAWVASCAGAMPPAPKEGLQHALEQIQRR